VTDCNRSVEPSAGVNRNVRHSCVVPSGAPGGASHSQEVCAVTCSEPPYSKGKSMSFLESLKYSVTNSFLPGSSELPCADRGLAEENPKGYNGSSSNAEAMIEEPEDAEEVEAARLTATHAPAAAAATTGTTASGGHARLPISRSRAPTCDCKSDGSRRWPKEGPATRRWGSSTR